MRTLVVLPVLALGFAAFAQSPDSPEVPPQPAPAPEVAPAPIAPVPTPEAPLPPGGCRADYQCPGRERCVDNVCTPPGGSRSSGGSSGSGGGSRVSLAIGLFGELFPLSSVKVPGSSSSYQMSVLAGGRVGVGYLMPKVFRAMGIIEGGYCAAGKEPGKGEQGGAVGFGAEGDLELLESIKPFVRFTYDVLIARISSNGSGRLAESAYVFAVGIRVLVFDFHVMLGNDFAGGFAPGIGFGVGWVN
jgi:hypothetical protein